MVAIKLVRESNEQLRSLSAPYSSPTGVFTGATQGIGLATLRQLAIHTVNPTCYIIGRSEERTKAIIDELKELNGKGKYVFVKGEVALLESVDQACNEIKDMIEKDGGNGLDILYMSQGYLTFAGRDETKEGLDTLLSLRYYSRLRFTSNLLPLLTRSHGRVVSVLAGGTEKKMYDDDLELKKNYGVLSSANHGATMTSLAFEHLSKDHPEIAFTHVYPGYVATNIFQSGFSWPVATFFKYILQPLLSFLAIPLPEVGDRQLFHATSTRYPSRSSSSSSAGVPLPQGVEVAEGIDGARGSGVYLVNETSDVGRGANTKVLKAYREEGMPAKVWMHTEDVFRRAIDARER